MSSLDVSALPPCHLFQPLPSDDKRLLQNVKRWPTWADIGRWKQ